MTVAILSICSAITFASAADDKNEIIVENYNISEEYSRMLSDEISRYSELDLSAQKTVSKNVTTVINLYRKELLDLQTHPDVATRPLSKEAGLAYAKGCSVGKIAWIYFYNLSSLEGNEATLAVRTKYEVILSSVSDATDSAVLAAKCEVFCAELNSTIYCELISALASKEDSLESSSVIAGGLEKIKALSSSDIFGKEHLALYEETKLSLNLQRTRDQLNRDMRSIYTLIRPQGNYQSDQDTALLTYKLKNAASISEMNASVQNTLEKLLEVSDSKQYAYLYASLLKQSISEAVIKANKQNVAADITPIFINYTLSKQRASTKDEIYAIVFSGGAVGDNELSHIEAEFNSVGGRLDKAGSKEEIECELIRARYVKECYTSLLSTQSEIDVILAPYDKTVFRTRARSSYDNCLAAIYKLSASSSFENNCKNSHSGLVQTLSDILKESKAERYLLDHKAIISKALSEISLDDELKLRNALSDYCALSKEVREALISQINSIVEKYNSLLLQKIRSYASNDALYLDICEIFSEEIKDLPRNNIDVFYNNCDLILKKAEELRDIIELYRTFCSKELYQSYSSEERERLVKICRSAAESLHSLDVNDKTMFESDLNEIKETACIEMQRTDQIVRLRIAARDSENTQIKAIVAESTARINASFDNAEMTSITDKAIFKINRLLTSDEILLQTEKEKLAIDALKFLTSEEKQDFKKKISDLCELSCNSAEVAENITILEFIWNTFNEEKASLSKKFADTDLERAQKAYTESFKDEHENLLKALLSLVHLSSEESDDFSNRATAVGTSLKADILSVENSNKAEELFLKSLETLNSLKLSAEDLNLKNYNKTLLSKISPYRDLKSNYSDENYKKILELISKFEATLASSKSLSESLSAYESADKAILSVNDLLDDAIDDAIRSVEARVSELRKYSTFYSSQALEKLDAILEESKEKLYSLSELSQISEAAKIGSEYLKKMDLVHRDYATSSPNGLSFSAEGAQYPQDYDISNGIWGLIHAPDRISAISKLSILPTDSDLKAIEKEIRRAARKDLISLRGIQSADDVMKALKKCRVLLGTEINIADCSDLGTSFTLQMLLPNNIASQNVLGLAFIDENGAIEFYSAEQRDALISVGLSHLSHYYVIAEPNTDLRPVIIALSIIVALELVILALIFYSRFKRKRKEKKPMFPLLSCFISPTAIAATAKTQPSGAISAVVLLSVTVLALGCLIALLTKAELRERDLAKKAQDTRAKQKKQEKNLLANNAPAALLRAKRAELASASSDDDYPYYPNESEVGKSAVLVEDMPKQTEEVDEFDGDVEIIEPSLEEISNGAQNRTDGARHKAEINLDTIEAKFGPNDLVTLDALKRKRLVPKKTDYVKILARGALTKPLVIEAHDFSRAAEEMLSAVGGEAIRIKS